MSVRVASQDTAAFRTPFLHYSTMDTPATGSSPLRFTPVNDIEPAVAAARSVFSTGKTLPLSWRVEQLTAIKFMLVNNKPRIIQALQDDLRRPTLETVLGEYTLVVSELDEALSHLAAWNASTSVKTPPLLMPGRSYIKKDPLGVVCVIAPWNFPIQLSIAPLIPAIAAGNCVVIKPSELAPACAVLLQEMISSSLDTDAIKVIQGGVEETSCLLRQKFDHIFYTGNGTVAKHVLHAAAEHLTPVTLELGGKSPVLVHNDANLAIAAPRIIVNKCLNAGQVCLAPDYVLVHQDIKEALVRSLKDTLSRFYGAKPQSSNDFGRIINARHFDRIKSLLDTCGGRVVYGGDSDAPSKYISPTLIENPDITSGIMQDEIFGPLLPILTYNKIEEAIAFVNSRPKPLGLYIFTQSSKVSKLVLDRTSSGGAVVNDCVSHIIVPDLPFGGIGASGMGSYHGKWGFDTFSHRKAVFDQITYLDPGVLRYPPYSAPQLARIEFLAKYAPNLPSISLRFILEILLAAAVIVLALKVANAL